MNNKISLIFVVVLAVSFVHSIPNLSGVAGNDGDQFGQLVSLIQRLNTPIALSKTKEKSGEPGEPRGEQYFGDLIFTTFFDDKDVQSDVETNPEYTFGPELNMDVFMARLDYDMEKALQRRCKKISGNDEAYGNVKASTKALGICLRNWSQSEGIRSDFSRGESFDDFKSFFRKVCRTRNVPMRCFETYMAADVQCSFPYEIEIENSVYRIVRNTFNLVCANNGNDFLSIFSEQGRQCFNENVDELKTCSNKALYAVVKGFFVKLIEFETFEFKMNANECKDFDDTKSCFASTVENCVDPIPKNMISSMFLIIRNETECAKITPLQTNFLK